MRWIFQITMNKKYILKQSIVPLNSAHCCVTLYIGGGVNLPMVADCVLWDTEVEYLCV